MKEYFYKIKAIETHLLGSICTRLFTVSQYYLSGVTVVSPLGGLLWISGKDWI